MSNQHAETRELLQRIRHLNKIGRALSAERDKNKLLEAILLGAKDLTHADGGTLYLVKDNKVLSFEIVHTNSIKVAMGGTAPKAVNLPDIPLFDEEGNPDKSTVAAASSLEKATIRIRDTYTESSYDFSQTRRFDTQIGYRSRSFLTVPIIDYTNNVMGVIQLINCMDKDSGMVIPFSDQDQDIVESLASQAATAMSNHSLINDLNGMFEGVIFAIADAIDKKSPYTGNHCRRVPILTMLLAHAINETNEGPFSDFKLSPQDMYELQIAAWLHDCGKVVTPVHLVNKATRLEGIFDRIERIDLIFEILQRDEIIKTLKNKLEDALNGDTSKFLGYEEELTTATEKLRCEESFLRRCNESSTIIDEASKDRIEQLGKREWKASDGTVQTILYDQEIENLQIPKGTLNDKERMVINDHVQATMDILNQLPYPQHLKNVPNIAGSHHERFDGKGYPKGLHGGELSVQARILCLADIFEALTSPDRPYKKAYSLSKALKIMQNIRDDGHIDPEVHNIFVQSKVWEKFAKEFLPESQCDLQPSSSSLS